MSINYLAELLSVGFKVAVFGIIPDQTQSSALFQRRSPISPLKALICMEHLCLKAQEENERDSRSNKGNI